MRSRLTVMLTVSFGVVATLASAQVTKETVPGITNFARVQTTIACAGATSAAAVPDIKRLGFASIINLRQANEQGADLETEAAAAKTAGINYVHLPFNAQMPDPAVVDKFLTAVTAPANQPAFVHCASANRAAGLWMAKRMLVDGWDADRAGKEAADLGLSNAALKTFVLDYVATHKK